jgi:hypothetical protein
MPAVADKRMQESTATLVTYLALWTVLTTLPLLCSSACGTTTWCSRDARQMVDCAFFNAARVAICNNARRRLPLEVQSAIVSMAVPRTPISSTVQAARWLT